MILSIQYLRALAALLVLMSHVAWKGAQYAQDPLGWFRVGASGVDVFFVISGYVMCHATRKSHGSANEIPRFMMHRFGRILPLYWALSTVALGIMLAAPNMVNSGGGTTDILKSYLLIPTHDKYLIQAGWTLSYEFFFYFIFSIGLLMRPALGHILTCACLLSLFILGRYLESMHHAFGDVESFATDALLVNFIFGIALFHIDQNSLLPKYMAPVAIILALIMIIGVNNGIIYHHFRCIRYGVPAFLLCLGLNRLEYTLAMRPSRLLNYLGDASYSIYLTHPFALALSAALLKRLGFANHPWIFLVAIAATAVLAGCACYQWLERPMIAAIRPRIDKFLPRAAKA